MTATNERTSEFLDLLGRHERRLQALVIALVPHLADADEIVQQIRLRLWEQFDQYDRSRDFGVWSRVIARYLVKQFYEKSSRQPAFVDPEFLDAVAGSFEAQSDESDARRRALSSCVEKLADTAQRLLLQYYSAGRTMKELAAAVGMTPASVKQSIYRSRLQVAECVDRTLKREARP